MIVKGHDFPNVTLVVVLAADMSLHVPDFHASERTFQLLTQAVGRAGRGKEPGQAVIQTYDPDHFAIQTAKEQDYDAFYKQEIAYRRMLAYPPVWQLILIHCTGTDPQVTTAASRDLAEFLHRVISQKGKNIMLVGPVDASIAKISDVYLLKTTCWVKIKLYRHIGKCAVIFYFSFHQILTCHQRRIFRCLHVNDLSVNITDSLYGNRSAGDDSCSQGSGRISASRDITERQKYYAGRTGRCIHCKNQ